MSKKILILGGGVAGMSAAHELIERGFEVEVYEKKHQYVGGKARSVDVPGTNQIDPEKFLPGEHGFRFFPGFYKHIIETMKRTPLDPVAGLSKGSVYDNLEDTDKILIARYDLPPVIFPTEFFGTWKSLFQLIKILRTGIQSGLTKEEKKFFRSKIWQLMCSCQERRDHVYEKESWWDFMHADKYSDAYRDLLVIGVTRTLVAAKAQTASTKTDGDIILQLIYNFIDPTIRTDRVFNGPSNEAWLNPWYNYLTTKGVKYHKGHTLERINMKNNKVESVTLTTHEGVEKTVSGDHYILCTPVERAAEFMSTEVIAADPHLGNLKELAKSVSWMNGMQFFLNQRLDINRGHVNYADTEWALTSFSQMQFWDGYDIENRFNGKVKDVLSVDISDWIYTEYKGKLAEDCDTETIKDFVWEQLEKSLNKPGNKILDKSMLEYYYLDRDIVIRQGHHDANKEKMLVNTVDSWKLRPEATTAIPNLFLASDYVRTNTDLATMEAANEAARRAVNGILDATQSDAPKCKLWDLKEPWYFIPLKAYDRARFKKGKSYRERKPIWLRALMLIWGTVYAIYFTLLVLVYMIFQIEPS